MSQITNYSNNIDTTFPVQGKDNPSAGFRDNFTAIKLALNNASSEITALQTSPNQSLITLGDGLTINTTTGATTLVPATSTTIGGIKQGTGTDITLDGTLTVNSLSSGSAVVSLDSNGILTLPNAIVGSLIGPGFMINVSTATGNFYNVLALTEFNAFMGFVAFGPGPTGIIETNGYLWQFAPDGRTMFPNYTFPAEAGTSTQILVNDGAGSLVWTTASDLALTSLPVASTTTQGIVRIGQGILVSATGTISVSSYTLPVATTSTIGGVKAYGGGSLSIQQDGTIGLALTFSNGTGTQINITWPNDGVTPPDIGFNLSPATTSTLGGVIVGAGLTVDNNGVLAATGAVPPAVVSTASIVTSIDGYGNVVTAGNKAFINIPYNCTVVGWSVLADQVGDLQFTVSTSTYATFPTLTTISGGTPVGLTGAQVGQSGSLSGWTTAVSAGNILVVTVVGTPTTITLASIAIQIQKV
jgi:hypothetical protein